MPDVEAWDLERDARNYAGPYPVVAHPPCGAWSALSHLSHGAGRECGPIAVDQVRMFGGALEQPGGSKLWRHCGLPDPWYSDELGYTVEVEQVAFGHVARKRTWLYFVDVPWELVKATMRRGGRPTHWCSGSRNAPRGPVPPGIKVCSAEQRRRTPIVFAHWLVSLAESVNTKCRGCNSAYERCGPALWAQQRKCCPDCSHVAESRYG
jgi:hypothetical protein